MFRCEDATVRRLLLEGQFGLERENLRVTTKGFLSHTPHPFPDDKHIVRDFSECQTEINTSPCSSAQEAVDELIRHDHTIQRGLYRLPEREYLWPFSNPPYIRSEEDIPVAQFAGQEEKTAYRAYLSDRYGRYIMTFSGIHVNFSFLEQLIERNFELDDETDYQTYKNKLYLTLAERASSYGWILTAVTAASPIMDSSYVEKGILGEDTFFNGMASLRSSEFGYWNFFAPIFDYSSICGYVDSIKKYVEEGFLAQPSELYYPIRLKSAGLYDLDSMRKNGASHIELRMFDLNPLVPHGLDVRDVEFAHLLLIWLICTEHKHLPPYVQAQIIHNFKAAAHYDLRTVKILFQNGAASPVAHAGLAVIGQMQAFFRSLADYDETIAKVKVCDPQITAHIEEILAFEADKFLHPEHRYAWQVRQMYADGFVKKGLELARSLQENVVMI